MQSKRSSGSTDLASRQSLAEQANQRRRAKAAARAAAMLARLKPFDEWKRDWGDKPPPAGFGATLEECYDRLKAEIEKEATLPSPREIHFSKSGDVKYIW